MKMLIEAKNGALRVPSEYNRIKLKAMIKDGITLFEIKPRIRGSKSQQKYLEGAVIPAYGQWQYGLDPRNPQEAHTARELFKLDFHSEVVKDKYGNPKRVPKSLAGEHRNALDAYTSHAQENGLPVPNEKLYKTWRDEYSMETRWDNYWDFLDNLGLECDAMPTEETIKQLI